MRISDWSSDVCSSDLVAVGVERQRVKLAAGQHAVARDAFDMRLATLARQRLAQRDIVRPQVARRELRRLVLDRVRLEIRHGLGSVRDIPILAQRAVWMCPTSRSEEHTSELQSLMRITYAVFCLKKT